MLTAAEARKLIDLTTKEYANKVNEEIQQAMPQIEDKIIKACEKTATSTTINLTYVKDYDPILRKAVRSKLIDLLREQYGYYVEWESTTVEESRSSWWKKKDEQIIDKIYIDWR